MKATNKQLIVALVILILVVIASSNFSIFHVWESVYIPQNEYEMKWLREQLDAKGIQYHVDKENHIVVYGEHDDLYDSFISKIREDRKRFSNAFGSSDKEFLKIIMKELEKAGIEYRINHKGEISFMKDDQPAITSIKSKVSGMLAGGIPKTFSNKAQRERFIYLLRKEGIEYSVLSETEGGWIKWKPRNDYQKNKILDTFQSGESSYESRNKT